MKVLVVKMSSLGDVIHTLPALTDASRALPGLTFDWVVEEAFEDVPRWHPAVRQVIPVALRRWRRRPLRDFRGPEWRRLRRGLRRARYDALIDAQGLLKSAFIARMVDTTRYGMDRRSAREGLASAVYHNRIHVPRQMHAVERTRLLFARALGYEVTPGSGDYGFRLPAPVPSQLAGSLLFFHGTARAEKLWPVEHWVDLANRVSAQGFPVWLPWGDESERHRARCIASAVDNALRGRVAVLPRMRLDALAGLLPAARAAVAVDTGLGHLAAAVGLPAVSLYGPTSPDRVGTYGKQQVHLQSGAAMADLSPQRVWAALQGLLQDNHREQM